MDSFLIIQNLEEDKILKIYNANTFCYLGALLDKGKGPDEVLECQLIGGQCEQGRSTLQIKTVSNQFFGIVDLDSSLRENRVCWKEKFDFMKHRKRDYLYRSPFYLGDSVLLVSLAKESYSIITSYVKLPDGGIRITLNEGQIDYLALNPFWLRYDYKTSCCSDTLWQSDYKGLKDYQRVRAACERMSPDKQNIAVAYELMNQVLFVNLVTKEKKLVTTDAKLPDSYDTGEGYRYFYSELCSTNTRVFAISAFPENPHFTFNTEKFIHVFDWNGRLRFKLNVAQPLKCPYLDEEKGFLYATDGEDNILRYDVRAFL